MKSKTYARSPEPSADTADMLGDVLASAPRRGVAARTETFSNLLERSKDAHAESVSTSAVVGLVLRGARILCPALSPAAVHLLALLVEHVYGEGKWKTGRLRITPSNARLAVMMGVSERQVRALLALLEANHWIIRRYTASNRRSRPCAGIDLAPVAARLADLREAVAWVDATGKEAREKADGERSDTATAAATGRMNPSSSADQSFHLKSVSGKRVEAPTEPLPSLVQPPLLASPLAPASGELVALMLDASPQLRQTLDAEDLQGLKRPRPPELALNRLTAAVGVFVRERVGMPGETWAAALTKHGWAALAAAVVVVERQEVKRKAAYLRVMFDHPKLAETVGGTLRQLKRTAAPRTKPADRQRSPEAVALSWFTKLPQADRDKLGTRYGSGPQDRSPATVLAAYRRWGANQ